MAMPSSARFQRDNLSTARQARMPRGFFDRKKAQKRFGGRFRDSPGEHAAVHTIGENSVGEILVFSNVSMT